MYKKVCPYCNGKSYSSNKESAWICPYCNRDITNVKSETPEN